MTMEKQPFEDVSPIKHGDFPASQVSFPGCKLEYAGDKIHGTVLLPTSSMNLPATLAFDPSLCKPCHLSPRATQTETYR